MQFELMEKTLKHQDRTLFATDKPDWISFEYGAPGPSLLPTSLVALNCTETLKQPSAWMCLQYGPVLGDLYFRRALAEFLSFNYNGTVDFRNLAITNGASQTLSLLLTIFTNPDTIVYTENPTYFLALRIFNDHGLKFHSVPTDSDGISINELEQLLKNDFAKEMPKGKYPRLLYLVPTFSNPSGTTLSVEKRKLLAKIAVDYNMLVICDEMYQLLGFENVAVPHRMFHFGKKNIISNCSFSKIVGPGLRAGWIEADSEIISRLEKCAILYSGGCPNHLMANVLLKSIENKSLQEHLYHIKSEYSLRCNELCKVLETELPKACSFTRPKGGFFVWIYAPFLNDELLVQFQERCSFTPGNYFSSDATHGQYLRIAFSFYDVDQLREGGKRLCRGLKALEQLSIHKSV